MLQEAEKLKAREFITAQDVIDGKQTLNMAYVYFKPSKKL